jgi:hypothetical protein
MPIEVGIWRIDNGTVRRVNAASLEAERKLRAADRGRLRRG